MLACRGGGGTLAITAGLFSSRDFPSKDLSTFGLGFWGLIRALRVFFAGTLVSGVGATGTGTDIGTGIGDGAVWAGLAAGDGPAGVGDSGGLLPESKPVGAGWASIAGGKALCPAGTLATGAC